MHLTDPPPGVTAGLSGWIEEVTRVVAVNRGGEAGKERASVRLPSFVGGMLKAHELREGGVAQRRACLLPSVCEPRLRTWVAWVNPIHWTITLHHLDNFPIAAIWRGRLAGLKRLGHHSSVSRCDGDGLFAISREQVLTSPLVCPLWVDVSCLRGQESRQDTVPAATHTHKRKINLGLQQAPPPHSSDCPRTGCEGKRTPNTVGPARTCTRCACVLAGLQSNHPRCSRRSYRCG